MDTSKWVFWQRYTGGSRDTDLGLGSTHCIPGGVDKCPLPDFLLSQSQAPAIPCIPVWASPLWVSCRVLGSSRCRGSGWAVPDT